MRFPELEAHLNQKLAEPLPGIAAQLRMAPPYRESLMRQSLENGLQQPDAKQAAVMAILFDRDGEPHMILTVRRPDLKDHAGQVSFPGGRIEANETEEQAAIREVEEEIGLPQQQLKILGKLTPLYIPPSNFLVYPFVAVYKGEPQYVHQADEVATILEVPLSFFLAPENRLVTGWERYGMQVDMPHFRVDEHLIWGATAMILGEFTALF